jgi:hypothetical protein
MAGIARLALIPIALAAAAVPALAQADAGAAPQSAALLGSVGSMRLYPFAGTQLNPLSNSLDATVAGVPLNSMGVTQIFSDGLPVRDLPGYSTVENANAQAQAAGDAALEHDAAETDAVPGS